jgi:hypothetical protein
MSIMPTFGISHKMKAKMFTDCSDGTPDGDKQMRKTQRSLNRLLESGVQVHHVVQSSGATGRSPVITRLVIFYEEARTR